MSSLVQLADRQFCLSVRSVYKKLENSAVTERKQTYITPDTGDGPYLQNSKIIFKFPTTNFFDPTTLRMEFNVTTTATTNAGNGNYGWANGVWDLIKRVIVKSGSTEIVDINNYNVWVNLNYKKIIPWANSVTQGVLLEGFNVNGYTDTCLYGGTPRATPTVNVPRQQGNFSHQFMCGIFQILQYFPTGLLNDLQLEIYLDTNANALMNSTGGSATGLSYSITQPRLYYDSVTFTEAFGQNLKNVMEASGTLSIPFYQVRNHEKAMSAGSLNNTFQINERVSSLNQLFCIPISQSRQNNENANSVGAFNPQNDWVQHRWRLNQTYFPVAPIDTFAFWQVMNLQACNQYGEMDSGGLVNRINASTITARLWDTAFVNHEWLCETYDIDFEKEKCPDLTSGYDTSAISSDIEFMIQYSSNRTNYTTNPNLTFMFFTVFDAMFIVNKNGTSTVFR